MEELKTRLDLSEWIIHFVHDRNPNNDPTEYCDKEGTFLPPYPYTFDDNSECGENLWMTYEDWVLYDSGYPIEPDASAFQVLQKILNDAHIRSGWSIRNERPTIFGLWPAVCFTEMPLYALRHYAKKRKDFESVNTYGICFKKQELFNAGARPVIYGISSKHKESPNSEKWSYNPRILSESCGISLSEQYRYVQMSMKGKFIDWSHEREWRWCDSNYTCHVPGLPLFGKEEPIKFLELLILVNSKEERSRIINKLKELFDARISNHDYKYETDTLRNTYVISLEELESTLNPEEIKAVKIEELPLSNLKSFQLVAPSPSFVLRVKKILNKANAAAVKAYNQYKERNKENHSPCGWAWVEIYESQSELVQALIEIDRVNVYGGIEGYRINGLLDGIRTQSLDAEKTAANAAKIVLEKEFPDLSFSVGTKWD